MKNGNYNNYYSYSNSHCSSKKQKTSSSSLNKATKLYLIKNGYFDLWRKQRKAVYYSYIDIPVFDPKKLAYYEKFKDIDIGLSGYQKKCCRQLFDSRRAKVSRLKKRIEDIVLNHDAIWLTLTFTDSVLLSTSASTRRVYIRRWLKSLNVPFFIARKDFGDKEKNPNSKEREHYHAIIQASKIDFTSYPYGIINGSRVRKSEKSVGRLAQYINKLSYHFFKPSSSRDTLIYSRNNS